MAHKVLIQLVDDLDGKELAEGEGETVAFALDGAAYEIDLSLKNADKFRGYFQDYIAAGRKAGRKQSTSSPRKPAATGPAAAEVREWARSNGFTVPDRGRIPAEVREAFNTAN